MNSDTTQARYPKRRSPADRTLRSRCDTRRRSGRLRIEQQGFAYAIAGGVDPRKHVADDGVSIRRRRVLTGRRPPAGKETLP